MNNQITVKYLDHMGTDETIVEDALHTQNRTKPKNGNAEFINGLLKRSPKHSKPFEVCEAKFEIECPIFVARQIMTHRTASNLEVSLRYTEACEYWLPKDGRVHPYAKEVIDKECAQLFNVYNQLIVAQVPKEVARAILPLGTMTRIRMKNDLWNWFNFLALRTDKAAQQETREVANLIKAELNKLFPLSMRAYDKYYGE